MKYVLSMVLVAAIATIVFVPSVQAADGDGPSLKISGKGEIWFEYSDGVGGNKGDSRIKANELYLSFDAKYNDGVSAKVKLDGADIVSRDGKTVSEKIIEEANVTAKEVCGLPLTLTFGKDEMPFGLDHDKALTDPIVHGFEIDKVWGLNASVAIDGVGSVGAAVYYHRHSDPADDRTDNDNEIGKNLAARLTVDKLVDGLKAQVSVATEGYSDTTDGTDVTAKDDELRWSVGAVYTIEDLGKVHVEYIGTQNHKGTPGYDPGVVAVGAEGNITDKVKLHVRYEKVLEDSPGDVETDFILGSVEYAATAGVAYFVEVMNFTGAGLADTEQDVSAKLGARIKF